MPAGACVAVGHKPASCSAYTQFFQHDRPENRSKSWIQRYYTHNISRNRLTLMKIGYNRQNLAGYTQFSMFLHLIVQNFLCMKWILGLLCPTATHKEKSGPLAGKAPHSQGRNPALMRRILLHRLFDRHTLRDRLAALAVYFLDLLDSLAVQLIAGH